jgi:monomeric isocitrate dehydrogenase
MIYYVVSAGKTRDRKTPHLVEVGDLCDVCEIYDSEVRDFVRDGVERFVHCHALAVPVVAESNYHHTVVLGLDSFIDVPSRGKMW